MVSVCLPSVALLQHLPSYLGFSYLGLGVSLHSCSSKAQPLLLTFDEGYLLTAALPDLQRGMAPLGLPAPVQSLLLGCGLIFPAATPDLRCAVAPLGHSCTVAAWHSRPLPLTSNVGSFSRPQLVSQLAAACTPELQRTGCLCRLPAAAS